MPVQSYSNMTARALIIDPDKHYRSILRSVLRNCGCSSIEDVKSVRGAIERIPSSEPDIIFVECNIPDASGLDFVRFVRSGKVLPRYDYPIIVMARRVCKSMVLKAAEFGADAFVLKPIQPTSIYQRLTPILTGRRLVFDRWQQTSKVEPGERLEI